MNVSVVLACRKVENHQDMVVDNERRYIKKILSYLFMHSER